MKKLLLMLCTVAVISCSDDQDPIRKGRLSFSFSAVADASGRFHESAVHAILISLEDETGNKIYDLEELTLAKTGDHLMSENIELPTGTYFITAFIVVNASREALYIAPLEGSEKALFVNHPLPMELTVRENELASTMVEVLMVSGEDKPADFGMTHFQVDFIDKLHMKVSFLRSETYLPGTLAAQGVKEGKIIWEDQFPIYNFQTPITCFDNVDSIQFTAISEQTITKSYSIEELKQDTNLVFDFSEKKSGFMLEVAGIDVVPTKALVTLRGEAGIYKSTLEYDATNDRLQADFTVVEPGGYDLTLSLFEGENIIVGGTESHTIFKGIEAIDHLDVTPHMADVLIQGPVSGAGDFSLEPEWEERYFATITTELVDHFTISFPAQACDFKIRPIPHVFETSVNYIYLDYYTFQVGEALITGIKECFSGCNVYDHFYSFAEEVMSEEDRLLCINEDWEMSDSIMYFEFDSDQLLMFYMRWDKDGVSLGDILIEQTEREPGAGRRLPIGR